MIKAQRKRKRKTERDDELRSDNVLGMLMDDISYVNRMTYIVDDGGDPNRPFF